MYKITNVTSLGADYTVADLNGKIINTIQVVPFNEILSATLGEYTDDFGGFSSYLEKCIAVLSGFDKIDPNRVLWYATSDEEVVLSEVIEYAIQNNYDKIILEHLEELE